MKFHVKSYYFGIVNEQVCLEGKSFHSSHTPVLKIMMSPQKKSLRNTLFSELGALFGITALAEEQAHPLSQIINLKHQNEPSAFADLVVEYDAKKMALRAFPWLKWFLLCEEVFPA